MVVESYVVAGRAPWSRETFERSIASLPGTWRFAATDAELTDAVAAAEPRYVFFLHWSSIIPAALTETYECVCFHMADLPAGRGGSPLQNLILQGETDTVVTAFRMVAELDAGPIYGKRPMSLHGSAEEIYLRAGEISASLIEWMIHEHPSPAPQQGEVSTFRRRTPAESELPSLAGLDELHDFIRMLDAEGYPHAYLDHGGFRFTFRRSSRTTGTVEADVTITRTPEETT